MGTRKKAYHHGDLGRALVEAAVGLVSEGGLKSLSLRATARRVGVSQAAPYRHFADKDALLLAVAEVGFLRMHQQIRGALGKAPRSPAARLEAIGVAYVGFAVSNPELFRLMFGPELARSEGTESAELAALGVFQELLTEIIRGQGSGVFRSGDAMGLAIACWSIAHGIAVIFLEGLLSRRPMALAGERTAASLAHLSTRLLIDGLSKGPSRTRSRKPPV